MRRDPSIIGVGSLGLAMSAALMLASRTSTVPRPPTREQRIEQDKRTERQRWNDEVERRKADKKAAKGSDK